ncbi:MAG TPA: permease prefix domain 1-containing protein [Ruminiclostridium sp.]
METIKNYLNNMFTNLPKSNQMLKLKNDLLSNMEDKYNELKNDGKSENEAIGIVISEFGNIDELISELGIDLGSEGIILPTITEEEAEDFMVDKKRFGLLIGIGVFLCIMGPAMLILITQLIGDGIIDKGFSSNVGDMLGIIALFIMIVPAIAIFIYSGMKLEKYKYLEGGFDLSTHLKASIQQENNAFTSPYILSVIIGVCLCLLSPVAVLVMGVFKYRAPSYGVVILLVIVAIAVFIFIYYGCIKESFSILLKIDDYKKGNKEQDKEENKVIGAVAAIVWPLAVCIFLISGFVFNQWRINWIIYPITALLFGMFSGSYSIMKGHKK